MGVRVRCEGRKGGTDRRKNLGIVVCLPLVKENREVFFPLSLSLSGSHNEVSLLPESAERRRSRKEKEKKTVKDEKVARKEGQTGTEKERERKRQS